MSRTRFRTQQLEREVRSSPVHWSEQSDSSDRDLDETDTMDRSPSPAIESQEYEAEDQDEYVDYELYRRDGKNRYLETSRSPVLKRRPINQHTGVTEEYTRCRGKNEMHHPENSALKFECNIIPERGTYQYNVHQPQLYEQGNRTQKSSVQVRDSINHKKHLIFIMISAVIVFLVLGVKDLFASRSEENSHTGQEDITATVIKALAQYENISGDVVYQLSAGIRSIVESDPNKPSIFVLLHNNTGDGPFCLAKAIGNIAMKYLDSDEENSLILRPVELLKDENMSQDYGWIIEHYKPQIEKHRSVIVTDLQELPGGMAMAFHFLCDIYNPVVPKSLFLFTLRVQNVSSKKEVEQAEKAMHNMWRDDVDNDKRQALITRLTEDIISLPLNILHNEGCP